MNNRISSDGKDLEKLVSRIYETIRNNPSAEVVHDIRLENENGGSWQFDVIIKLKVAGSELVIAIECKDYGKTVEATEIYAFSGKCDSIKNICRKIFVAVNGYQSGAIGAAQQTRVELYDLKAVSLELIQQWVDVDRLWGSYFDARRLNSIHLETTDGRVISIDKADLDFQMPIIDPDREPITLRELITVYSQQQDYARDQLEYVFEKFSKVPIRGDEKSIIVIAPSRILIPGETFEVILSGRSEIVDSLVLMIEYVFNVSRPSNAVARLYKKNQNEPTAHVYSCQIGKMILEIIRDATSGQTKYFAIGPDGKAAEVIIRD